MPEGHELRADREVNGATVTSTVTAGPDGALFRPTELGRYYLAHRERTPPRTGATAGLLVVVPLANADYEALCSELDAMNAAIRNEGNLKSFIQWQVTTPDGTSVTRMTLGKALVHRATAGGPQDRL